MAKSNSAQLCLFLNLLFSKVINNPQVFFSCTYLFILVIDLPLQDLFDFLTSGHVHDRWLKHNISKNAENTNSFPGASCRKQEVSKNIENLKQCNLKI